jgi:hypothetical protein
LQARKLLCICEPTLFQQLERIQFIDLSYPTQPHPIKQSLFAFVQPNGPLHPQIVAHVPVTSFNASAKHAVVPASSTQPEAEKLKAKVVEENNAKSKMEIIIVSVHTVLCRSVANMGRVKKSTGKVRNAGSPPRLSSPEQTS